MQAVVGDRDLAGVGLWGGEGKGGGGGGGGGMWGEAGPKKMH